ncbi:MAG: zinc-finger domain-containing protein [Halorhodospira sp.]
MPDPQTHDRDDLIEPNAAGRYEVTARDLPLACPMPGMYLWNSHPRVYLPVHEQGRATCPYCGATYVLREDDRLATHIGGRREWK